MSQVIHGDSLEELWWLDDESVHAVVCDPPYGISFMGKQWDQPNHGSTHRGGSDRAFSAGPVGVDHLKTTERSASMHAGKYDLSLTAMQSFEQWCRAWAVECLRVLKPGGHLLAFGGARTWHRLAAGIEDAGFEMRDSIAWLYGSGFPKSMDVSKAIDKAAGAERKVVAEGAPQKRMIPGADQNATGSWIKDNGRVYVPTQTEAGTSDAAAWEGWGTALKPAFEPIVVARKPIVGTVAATVLAHGTGALNIDGSRIGKPDGFGGGAKASGGFVTGYESGDGFEASDKGRWPANVILDESQAALLDEQAPSTGAAARASGPTLTGGSAAGVAYGARNGKAEPAPFHGDIGGASRFFYVAKAPKRERPTAPDGAAHPTVKPLSLMRHLVRLVTPPGGVVLDPFAGSGTTIEAAILEGFDYIGIEREAEYLPLIEQRIARATA